MTKKTKLTRTLMAAVSVVALSAVVYGCSSGVSDADHQAALDKAKAAEELAAAEKKAAEEAAAAAKTAAEEAAKKAEEEKQAAIEAERKAAEERAAAAEKMARATVQTNAITAAITAAETALGMVVLDASDADITAAEAAIAAITTAIEAAVDVADTSMYTAQVTGLNGRLMTAKSLVLSDRDAKKMARAEIQKGAITTATGAAEAAVALVVEGASNDDISKAEAAVQAAKKAIADAVDVEDTSMYTETVNGIASSLMTAKSTVLADRLNDRIELQKGAISAAIQKAQSAVGKVILGASDMDISDAETAIRLANEAIAAAEDVEDTGMYTATINGLTSSLATAKTLVIADRAAKMGARAQMQMSDITDAIEDAEDALEMVGIKATDMDIKDARDAVQAVKDAIKKAVDVDDTSSYTAQIDGIEGRLDTAEIGARQYRAVQQRDDIDMAVSAAEDAVEMVGPDADDDDVDDADMKVKALMDALDDAANLSDEDKADDKKTLEGLQNMLADRKALRKAITAAMDALRDLDNESSDDEIEDVQDLIDDAEDAIDDAEHLSDDEKAKFTAKIDDEDDGLQAMLDAEEKTIMAARTGVDTMATADKGRAEGLATALDTDNAGSTDEATGMFVDSVTLSATAKYVGSKVEITPVASGGGAGSGDFKMQAAGPAGISGWTGQKFTRAVGATDTMVEHVTVYTDIDAPKPMAFTAPNLQSALGLAAEPSVTGADTPTPMYDLPANNDDGVYGYVTWGSAARPTVVNKTDANNDPDVDSRSFTGYLAGAMGKFMCTGDADGCALTFDEKGMISGLTGTWTFTADRGAMVKVADSEYLHFGWWIDRPTEAGSNGSYSYGFQTFAGGMGTYTPANLTEVAAADVKATYNGAAAGVYVTKDISGGRITDASMGEFTAAARLSANFGLGTSGVISGSISNFKGADDSAMTGWRVDLDATDITATASFAGATMGTTGPGATGTGSWEGMFYGDPTNADGTDDTDAAPMGAAGRFDAHLQGTHIAGGFGATR